MIGIVGITLRAFQILFGVVALALSITLIKGQHYGDKPASLGFAAFAGAITLVGGLIGIAGTWVSLLQGALIFAVDGLIAVINIAAGVLLAYKLHGSDCSNTSFAYRVEKLENIDLLHGGCIKDKGETFCEYTASFDAGKLNERCRQATADSAFLLMTVFLLIATVLVTWLRLKNNK